MFVYSARFVTCSISVFYGLKTSNILGAQTCLCQQFQLNYPNIKLIIMEGCPRSRNDEEMFKAAFLGFDNI